jgi:adenylosuccinate lyase
MGSWDLEYFMHDFETYSSPFSWRYGSDRMRQIWGERNRRHIWRTLWLILAEVQAEFGLVSTEKVEDIRVHVDQVDLQASLDLESEIHHDLMAELKVFTRQCSIGGGVLHLGATSMDIKDNADVLLVRMACDLVLDELVALLQTICVQIERYAETPIIAFTHLQPAEPSTLGFRLAQYAQDVFEDYGNIKRLRNGLRGKGIRGAVGTGASFIELLGRKKLPLFEEKLSTRLGLPFYPVVTQTYPRKQDYEVVAALAGLGASIYKFAFDLRFLQSPPIGEVSEPFSQKQVGSSAMPFKRNPVIAERLNSIGRYLAQLPRLAWDNAAHSLLERTLDDSANRRTLLPEAFLTVDELLQGARVIIDGMQVDEKMLADNLLTYGPFAATERVMMALVKAGVKRQEAYERLRQYSLQAWDMIRQQHSNPLSDLICSDNFFLSHVERGELRELMAFDQYVGDAPERARDLALRIREGLHDYSNAKKT